jgi:hypothetical protein
MENAGFKPELVKPFIGFIILTALLGLSLLLEKLVS